MTDPVTAHVVALERALRGPARTRRSMITEVRDGLEDAAAAYRQGGLDPQRAAAAAVRDFGAVHEVAPLLQEELAARQARWTSALLAVAFPGMLLGWDVLWSSGVARVSAGPAPALVGLLARLMDAQSILVAVAAVALLLATFHRGSCRRVTRLIGLTGVLGLVGVTVTCVLMHLASTSVSTAPAALLAYALTCGVLAALARSCVRTLRLVR